MAAALYAAALPAPLGAVEPCAAAGERTSRDGWSLAAACGASADRPLRGPARRLFGLALDPNSADAATLETLPGIGVARARAIVRERARRPFRNARDLTRVPGIGAGIASRLAGLVAVEQTPGEPGGGS